MDPTEAFGGKAKEKKLTDQMKSEFSLVKKSHRYSIYSITDKVVQFSMQILSYKIMRKYRVDEVPASIISLAAQCAKGVQYN